MPFLEIPPEPTPLDNDDHDDSHDDSVPSAGVEQGVTASAERTDVAEDHAEFTGTQNTEYLVSALSLEEEKTEDRTREDGKPGEEECESSEDRLDYRGEINIAL